MAESLLVKAAVGAAFGELLNAVLETRGKAILFKQTLAYLQYTLEAIAPVIKEIEQQNNDLGRPKEELELLIKKMEEGKELLCKCSKIHRLNFVARVCYNGKLEKLIASLVKFFAINMQAYNSRDQKETLLQVRKILGRVNKFPLVKAENTAGSSSSDSIPVSQLEMYDSTTMQPADENVVETNHTEKAMENANQVTRNSSSGSGSVYFSGNEDESSIPNSTEPVENSAGTNSVEQDTKGLVFLDHSYSFDIDELTSASSEFIGKGSYGTTYKAILNDGRELALKMLKNVVEKREFERQVKNVHALVSEHPNVIPIRAYFYGDDVKMLIYDYMMAGSFFELLHGGTRDTGWTQLDWDSRMKIAHGAAAGIAHIHSASTVHGNIKSSNILVTQDMRGCISDFGLNRLTRDSVNPSGNKGYRAPELVDNTRLLLTKKCDVYSFGVLLFQMLTDESPLRSLVLLKNRWEQLLFDSKNPLGEKQAFKVAVLARECMKEMPQSRPSMAEVVKKIAEIRGSNKF